MAYDDEDQFGYQGPGQGNTTLADDYYSPPQDATFAPQDFGGQDEAAAANEQRIVRQLYDSMMQQERQPSPEDVNPQTSPYGRSTEDLREPFRRPESSTTAGQSDLSKGWDWLKNLIAPDHSNSASDQELERARQAADLGTSTGGGTRDDIPAILRGHPGAGYRQDPYGPGEDPGADINRPKAPEGGVPRGAGMTPDMPGYYTTPQFTEEGGLSRGPVQGPPRLVTEGPESRTGGMGSTVEKGTSHPTLIAPYDPGSRPEDRSPAARPPEAAFDPSQGGLPSSQDPNRPRQPGEPPGLRVGESAGPTSPFRSQEDLRRLGDADTLEKEARSSYWNKRGFDTPPDPKTRQAYWDKYGYKEAVIDKGMARAAGRAEPDSASVRPDVARSSTGEPVVGGEYVPGRPLPGVIAPPPAPEPQTVVRPETGQNPARRDASGRDIPQGGEGNLPSAEQRAYEDRKAVGRLTPADTGVDDQGRPLADRFGRPVRYDKEGKAHFTRPVQLPEGSNVGGGGGGGRGNVGYSTGGGGRGNVGYQTGRPDSMTGQRNISSYDTSRDQTGMPRGGGGGGGRHGPRRRRRQQ